MQTSRWKFNLIEFIFLCYVLFAFLAIDDFFAFKRFRDIGLNTQGNFTISEYIRQAVFISEYVFATLSFYYLTRTNKKYGLPALALVWILLLIDASIHKIIGRPADIFYISSLNAAIGNTNDALAQFKTQILSSVAATSILMIPLFIKACITVETNKGYRTIILAGLLALTYGFILIARGSPALIGFPKGYAYAYASISLLINDFSQKLTKTENIKTFPYPAPPSLKNIIVIIDESVEYKEFSKLYKNDIPYSINYGQAYSGGNCSASSNYIIRRATWDKNKNTHKLDIKKVESLFSLAKKSLFKTIYIDIQNVLNDPTVRNYFDNEEIANIDFVIQADGNVYERDLNSLESIKNQLGDENLFILINKMGAHFPYEQTIPLSLMSPERMINYRNSVNRNSIEYLKELTKIIDDETIVFYTSDHGQDFNSLAPQCNTGNLVSTSEYSVPFIVISKDNTTYQQLLSNAYKYKNALTHIEFSESIRNIIGYEIEDIDSIFKNNEKFTNKFCGLYGQPKPLFGINPDCKRIQ